MLVGNLDKMWAASIYMSHRIHAESLGRTWRGELTSQLLQQRLHQIARHAIYIRGQ